MKSLDERVRFDRIRYANCWEDADILCRALLETEESEEPKAGRILSIASGGDNCFALLAAGAEQVVAADLSIAQMAVVELKAVAIRRLEREQTLRFLGVEPCSKRVATYSFLADDLSPMAWAFWSRNLRSIHEGLIHHGKFERYFAYFRRFLLPWVHGKRTVESLMEERDITGRRRFHDEVWNTRRWRWLFRLFFSRAVMGRLGRDPEFFRYVEGPVAERILARARHAMIDLPTHENPYLEYILTGTFQRSLPIYLRPLAYDILRDRLDRLVLERGDIAEVGRRHRCQGFDGFNLSDIFEYLDPATAAALYDSLLALANPGARFAYWNLLAPRWRPDSLRPRVDRLPLGPELHRRDLAFFYSAFHVEAAR